MAWTDKARKAAAAARRAKKNTRIYMNAQGKLNQPVRSSQVSRLVRKRDAASSRMVKSQLAHSKLFAKASGIHPRIDSRTKMKAYEAMAFSALGVKRK